MVRDIIIETDKCVGCGSCELACAIFHSFSQDLSTAIGETPLPISRIMVDSIGEEAFPTICHHCENPPCVDACMASAMHKEEGGSLVLVDKNKCVGCWMCVMVCPFAAVIHDNQHKKALKCDKCLGEEIPWCVGWCPTNAIRCGKTEDWSQTRARERVERTLLASHAGMKRRETQ